MNPLRKILLSIGNFLLDLIKINSELSSKRICLLVFMGVVTLMWVIMSFKQGMLASVDSGVVAIIVALSGAASADHFAPNNKNAKPGECRDKEQK